MKTTKKIIQTNRATNIRCIRNLFEYNQENVAESIQISLSLYKKYESEKLEIPEEIVEKLGQFYNLNLISFIDFSKKDIVVRLLTHVDIVNTIKDLKELKFEVSECITLLQKNMNFSEMKN